MQLPKTTLAVQNQRLTQVPYNDIEKQNPKVADFSGNHIQDLNGCDEAMASVAVLTLSRNRFWVLNLRTVGLRFPNLVKLELRQNKLESVRQLSPMPSLTYLDLGKNLLSSLPAAFYQSIPKVQTLLLDNNQIEFLAPELCDLTHLRTLHLHANHFAYLPASMFFTMELQELGLEWFNYLEPSLKSPFPP